MRQTITPSEPTELCRKEFRGFSDRARWRRTLSGEPQSIIAADSDFYHCHHYCYYYCKTIVSSEVQQTGNLQAGPSRLLLPTINGRYYDYFVIVLSELPQTVLLLLGIINYC